MLYWIHIAMNCVRTHNPTTIWSRPWRPPIIYCRIVRDNKRRNSRNN
jgi:hypothetical protein